MAYWRDRTQWEHTASIISATINANVSDESQAMEPSEISPYTAATQSKRSTINLTRDNIDILQAFAGRKP